jgi:molecular chaperone DnaK (HSP70)
MFHFDKCSLIVFLFIALSQGYVGFHNHALRYKMHQLRINLFDKVYDKSVGIDLGTTYSAISIIENGLPKIIAINGCKITPSIVSYTKNGTILVGKEAKNRMIVNSERTFSSVKRMMGKSLLKESMNETKTPEEISAEILKYLINGASEYLGA